MEVDTLRAVFRDLAVRCPRCRRDLQRHEARSVWRCDACDGTWISETELARRLLEVAPDLAENVERVGGVAMPERGGQPNRLPCAICAESMQPVFLGGIELDRCVRDRHAWFDTGELARVVAIAQRQHDQRTSLLLRVLSFLR